jgi:hypothetical protein
MLKAWKVNRGDQNDKIIQVLAYAYMYETEAKSKPMRQELFLLSLNRVLPFNFKEEKRNMIINEEMTNYLEQIVLLLNEILDVSIPFEE